MIPLTNNFAATLLGFSRNIRQWRDPLLAKAFRQNFHEQWRSPQEIKYQQLEALKRLLKHAEQNVPYYQKIFADLGFQPERLDNLSQLQQLPFLTKKTIRENLPHLVARNFPKENLRLNHTGGSTGEPLTFYNTTDCQRVASAATEWCYHLSGYRPGLKRAFLWGSERDLEGQTGWGQSFHNFATNTRWYNSFRLPLDQMRNIAWELKTWPVEFLCGYSSSVFLLARFCLTENLKIPLKGCQTTAGTLHPSMRQTINAAFGVEPHNRYGCREMGLIACDCDRHQGLHVLDLDKIVEIIGFDEKPARPGEIGRIIVTDLNNFGMPWIRYEIRDLAVASHINRCACGRGLSLVDQITGRDVDVIYSPRGRLIPGELFTILFFGFPGVAKFQVVQETRKHLHLALVWDGKAPVNLARLRTEIHRLIDPDFEIDFQLVTEIPPSPSGKFSFTVSKVPLPF